MFQNIKNTLITAIIGGLITIMWGGLDLPANDVVMPVRSAYVAPVVQSGFDWWWSKIMWSLLPLTIVVLIVCGMGIVLIAIRNSSKTFKPVRESVHYEVIPPAKPNNMLPLEAPPVERVFSDGLRKLTRTEIPLGYTKKGEIVTWDVTQSPHIRVHGKTQGSGKTNLIRTIAVCAVRAGHHVIVLDRRGFKDWRDLERHAELIDNRQEGTFPNVTSQIKSLYQKRDAVLGQYGAGNIEELPKKYKRVFVVIAEFGTACREIADDELVKVVKDLKSIMSESGSTGVHLIYESQVVNHDWPRELRGNGDPICGYLPEDTSKAGGYSYAYQLKPYEFHYDGERFTTWDMKKYAWQVLNTLQPSSDKLIVSRSVTENYTERSVNATERRPNGNRTANTLENSQPFAVQRTFGQDEFAPQNAQKNNFSDRTPNTERSAELRSMVWQWRDSHPTGTQAELRKEFAGKGIDIARGYVHACWHSWEGHSS